MFVGMTAKDCFVNVSLIVSRAELGQIRKEKTGNGRFYSAYTPCQKLGLQQLTGDVPRLGSRTAILSTRVNKCRLQRINAPSIFKLSTLLLYSKALCEPQTQVQNESK
jgi:hypothetical protein